MTRYVWLAIWLCACESAHVASTPIDPWEPVDPSFAGCQGACGGHVSAAVPDGVVQPGATLGSTTYCPVSGAVFQVEARHPHVDVDGQRLYFCCDSCAQFFAAHRTAISKARAPRISAIN